MGVSETSATSSNYAYDDQYASTNESSPQDSSTTGNDSGLDNASTSDTTANGSTGASPAAGNDQASGDAWQTSSATSTQSQVDSGDTTASTDSTTNATSADSTSPQSGDSTAQAAAQSTTQGGDGTVSDSAGSTAKQDAAPNAASPESSGTTAGAKQDGGTQGENGQGSSSSRASANSQQAGGASKPRDTQGSDGAEGASVPATGGTQSSASANTQANRDTGGSAQAGPALGTQGNNANASTQTAPSPGMQGNNTTASAQAAPSLGTLGGNTNASAQAAPSPGTQGGNANASAQATPSLGTLGGNTNASAQAAPSIGKQGGNANASAQAAPALGTQGGNANASAQAIPSLGKQSGNANTSAQAAPSLGTLGGNTNASAQSTPSLGTQGGNANASAQATPSLGKQSGNANASAQAAPPLGRQGNNTDASAQAAPALGTLGNNVNASAQPAPSLGTLGNNPSGAAPHSANASAQQPVAPNAANPQVQHSPPANLAPHEVAGKTSQHRAAIEDSQGNRSGDAQPAGSGLSFAAPNPPSDQASTNTQSQPSKPVLNGATQSELKGLLAKYDNENDGRTQDSQNRANDATTGSKIQQANDLDYTGYPEGVQAFEHRLSESQAQLAALPPEMRDYYGGQMAALDTAYRNITSSDARAALNQKAEALQNDILAEYNHSINDPLDRTMAIFNHPVGAGYLDKPLQSQLQDLDKLRQEFLNAPDAAHREALFQKAEQLKIGLQRAAADGVDTYLKKDQAAWNEAYQDVDKLVDDARNIQDPFKRYKSIGDGLFSFNTGMGEDSVADRRVLAFTQRMQDDPDLRAKLDQWQFEAGKPLNADGVSAALPYTQILNNLPPAGPDYVRDLGDQYNGVIKGQTAGERVAAFNRAKPYVQVAEGFARFMLGLTPLAPLSTVLDGASTLSPSARLGIDIGSAIVGGAVDPFIGGISAGAKGASRFIQEFRAEAAAADESEQGLKLGLQDGKLAVTTEDEGSQAAKSSAEAGVPQAHLLEPEQQAAAQGGEAAQTAYKPAEMGPSLDPRMLEARSRIDSNPMAVPSRYATEVNGNALKPDENAPGVLNDANNQHYIQSGGQYFKAKYDSDNETWRAVNPESPNSFSYPVRYDPQSGTWSVHGDVGGPGGGPLSRLVSLGKYAKNDPRIAKLIDSKILKPQNSQTCFLDHGRVAQHVADVPDGRLKPVSTGPLNAQQLTAELNKGPLVLSARNIARPDSNYSGMHTVVLLKTVEEDGHQYVLGVDLDDTIGRNGQAQNLANGDFGGVRYDLDQLTKQATPYVDEDTGMQLEMYQRPQENKGIWGWFS